MNKTERENLAQIEALNQRGGRTLSVVDLIDAGTMDAAMSAYLLAAAAGGASFLTAARPGGAGKSTVLANLLNFLPPGERIVTVSRPEAIDAAQALPAAAPLCALAHEIGSGPWFGYIWGKDVERFFRLMDGRRRIASCQHADTLEELTSILRAVPLHVSEESIRRLDLALFLHVDGRSRPARRRVAAVYEADGEGHRLVFQWNAARDAFEETGPSALLPRLAERLGADAEEIERVRRAAEDFIRELVRDEVRDFGMMRRRVTAFYADFGDAFIR